MTRSTFRQNLNALSRAQKASAGAPLYSRLINRPWGRALAALAHTLGMTPDQVTFLSMICTYVGIALMAIVTPSVVTGILVSFLLMFGYALDSADGQLARLRHGGSKAGGWLDHVADSIKLATIHLSVAISLYRFADLPNDALLLIPLAFSAVQCVHFFSYILTYQLQYGDGSPLATDEKNPGFLKSILSLPTDYGLMCVVLALRFEPLVFLGIYGLMLLGYAGYVALALPTWYRRLARQG